MKSGYGVQFCTVLLCSVLTNGITSYDWRQHKSWYIDIHTVIQSSSNGQVIQEPTWNDGRHLTISYSGRTEMTATWSQQVTYMQAGLPNQTWFVPVTEEHMLPVSVQDLSLASSGGEEVSDLELDYEEWKDVQLALSYISREGNVYYYRRLQPFSHPMLVKGKHLDWRNVDRIGEHFPSSRAYEQGENVSLTFQVYVNSSLEVNAICVWLTYSITGNCSSNCSAEIHTQYLYSDWDHSTVKDDHVTVIKTTNISQAPDDTYPGTIWYPAEIQMQIDIENANQNHSGQYVCNIYTEPFDSGASFHTQTKLIYGNDTHMWPRGFALAQLSICGKLIEVETQSEKDDSTRAENVTIPAGMDNCLLCYGTGYPSPNMTFEKDGEPLPLTPDLFQMKPEEGDEFKAATYILRDVTIADSGTYSCHASNDVTQGTDSVTIIVQDKTDLDDEY